MECLAAEIVAPNVLTVGDLSRRLSKPDWRIRRLLKKGAIPVARVGPYLVVTEAAVPLVAEALEEADRIGLTARPAVRDQTSVSSPTVAALNWPDLHAEAVEALKQRLRGAGTAAEKMALARLVLKRPACEEEYIAWSRAVPDLDGVLPVTPEAIKQ